MKYIFTTDEVEQLEKTAPMPLKQQIAAVVVPRVISVVKQYSEREAYIAGRLVGWMALKGKDAIRLMPQYFLDNLSFDEPTAYTIADAIVDKCGDALQEAIPGFDIKAIRVPWKGKVKPSLLAEKADGIAEPVLSGSEGSPRSGPRNDKIVSVSAVPEPEVVAFEQKGLRHQDAEERLAIRVRMIEQLAGIKFNDQNLEERFRHAIRPALKGVKELDEVQRDLGLTEDKGGVGMGQDQVDEVIGLIERLEAKDRELAARATVAKPEPPKSMALLPSVILSEAKDPVRSPSCARDSSPSAQNDSRTTAAQRDSSPSAQNDSSKKLDQLIRQSAADQPMDLQRKMHDVVARPIAMGPIEELRSTNLTDFRRLAAKAGAAADKIRQKLAVLREDGIDRYAAGIKAWRESPVYGVYTKMIRDGLVEGRTVEDLAASDTGDPERLSGEELQAVIELNRSLRF